MVVRKVIRTDANHPGFQELVRQLDKYLALIDGEDHGFYHQFNGITMLKHVIIITENDVAVACGAIKPYDKDSVEIKRMFTAPSHRGKGLAKKVVAALEQWALELHYNTCILETGLRQVEAITLYETLAYQKIENFGQYSGVENSVCFSKQLLAKN